MAWFLNFEFFLANIKGFELVFKTLHGPESCIQIIPANKLINDLDNVRLFSVICLCL